MYYIYVHAGGDAFQGYRTKLVGWCETEAEAEVIARKHEGWYEYEEIRSNSIFG